jgi:hypothetical protein
VNDTPKTRRIPDLYTGCVLTSVGPCTREPPFTAGLVVLGCCCRHFEHTQNPLLVLLNVLLGEGALFDETLSVLSEGCWLLLDGFVHPRLGKAGLIGLIVAIPPIAHNIDNNVLLELRAPVSSELTDEGDSFNIVAVDVEDGRVKSLGQVARIGS